MERESVKPCQRVKLRKVTFAIKSVKQAGSIVVTIQY